MDDEGAITYDDERSPEDRAESWLAEQARLVLLEDGG
jgi:hypothetical protein